MRKYEVVKFSPGGSLMAYLNHLGVPDMHKNIYTMNLQQYEKTSRSTHYNWLAVSLSGQ